MAQVERERSSEEEATTFNAVAHLKFFREILALYHIEFDSWCICLLDNNTAVDHKTARDCNKPSVGCLSHKLQLYVNVMVLEHEELSEVLDSVYSTMIDA